MRERYIEDVDIIDEEYRMRITLAYKGQLTKEAMANMRYLQNRHFTKLLRYLVIVSESGSMRQTVRWSRIIIS